MLCAKVTISQCKSFSWEKSMRIVFALMRKSVIISNDHNRSFSRKGPETPLPVSYPPRGCTFRGHLDWRRKNIGRRDKSANTDTRVPTTLEGGGRRGGERRIRNRPARRANLLYGYRRIARPPLAQVIILERSLMRLGEPGGLQRPEIVPPWPPRSSPARGPPSRKPCIQPHSLSRGQRMRHLA